MNLCPTWNIYLSPNRSRIPSTIQDSPEDFPVPVKWNRGLEGATSYEWIKNGRGSGADFEMVDFTCPWIYEDVKREKVVDFHV